MAPSCHDPGLAVAVASFRRHHPAVPATVVCGALHGCRHHDDGSGVAVLAARGLAAGDLRYIDAHLAGGAGFAMWAVVPAAVRSTAGRPGVDGPTLILPAHAWVLAPLDDLADGVPADGIGLAPLRADVDGGLAFEGWLPGLAVVGPDAAAALDAWERRAGELARDPRRDPSTHGWADGLVGGPAVVALLDPTVRLAPSTAGALTVDGGSDAWTIDGAPARLVHFPSFDPARSWWYSESPDVTPLALASDHPALAALTAAYAGELDAGSPEGEPAPPRRTTTPPDPAPGIAITPAYRREFRRVLRDGPTADGPVPNPFDPATVRATLEWLREPGPGSPTGISRAVDFLWDERPDLAAAFPHVRWRDRHAFVAWLWTHGLDSGLITTALLPAPPTTADATPEPTPGAGTPRRHGVNLVGYHGAELGLGVAVRRVGAALDAAGIPWTPISYDRTHSRNRVAASASADAPYWFNLILVAPDQLQFFVDDVGDDFLRDHYNIGLWYWETDAMTDRQIAAFAHVDEVWASTTFLTDVFSAHTAKPVTHVPVPLEFAVSDEDRPTRRRRLGLDDRFTFLFSFDFLSISRRKNPLGLVEAYRRAFDVADGCRLILKSINGDRHPLEAEEIHAAVADRPDIELWDRYLDPADRIALVAEADCYVSLHRSEGLGLTMAEAMAAGTPVIASAYSGNLDFMDASSALLVDVEVVEIGEGSFYPATGHWADPDLDQAAELMVRVRDDEALRARLAAAGPVALRPFTARRVGEIMRLRLEQLWR